MFKSTQYIFKLNFFQFYESIKVKTNHDFMIQILRPSKINANLKLYHIMFINLTIVELQEHNSILFNYKLLTI